MNRGQEIETPGFQFRGCNPISVHRPPRRISRHPVGLQPTDEIRGAGRDPHGSWRGALRTGTTAETIQTQVITELWVPAFAGMARNAHSELPPYSSTTQDFVIGLQPRKRGSRASHRNPAVLDPRLRGNDANEGRKHHA